MNRLKLTEILVVISTIFIFSILNLWHVIKFSLVRPPETVYIGVTHFHEDYFYYLSQVAQGAEGSWKTSNLFTSESVPPVSLWLPNILLGKIASVLNAYPWTIYNWALFLVSVITLFLTYLFCRRLYTGSDRLTIFKRTGAFIIAVTTSMAYSIKFDPDGIISIATKSYFYNFTASLNRIGGVFHLVLQNALSISVLLIGSDIIGLLIKKETGLKTLMRTILLSILLVALTLINPVYTLINLISLAISAVILLWGKPDIRLSSKILYLALVALTPLLIPYAVIRGALQNDFYRYFRSWEATIKPASTGEVIGSMGMIFYLALPGLGFYLKKLTVLRSVTLAWLLVQFILYFSPVPGYLRIPYFRLLQPPSYTVMGVAAMEILILPYHLLHRFRYAKTGIIVSAIFVGLYVSLQVPAIRSELDARLQNHILPSWLNNVERETMAGLLFLKSKPAGLTLSIGNLELLVPVVSVKPVYVGHSSLTLDYPRKIGLAAKFFSRNMTPVEAREFLNRENIKYIISRNDNVDSAALSLKVPDMAVIYKNKTVTVWTRTPQAK